MMVCADSPEQVSQFINLDVDFEVSYLRLS